MKRIEALIRHYKLHEVKDALTACGVDEITVSVVRGFGRQHGHREWYRGAEYTVDFVSKARLEVLVSDELASEVIETILKTARTGAVGDGKIFVRDYSEAIPAHVGDAGEYQL
jgi:nitrogen regulatory protein P-II 1